MKIRDRAVGPTGIAPAGGARPVSKVGKVAKAAAAAGVDATRTPPKVVIDESIQLSQWFGGAKTPAFVNGVLDRIAHSLGRL